MNTIQKALDDNNQFNDAIEILAKHKPLDKAVIKALGDMTALQSKLYDSLRTAQFDIGAVQKMVEVQMHLVLLQSGIEPEALKAVTNNMVALMVGSVDFGYYLKKHNENGQG